MTISITICDYPGGSDGKATACNAGDPGLIPGSGRSPGEGNGNPLREVHQLFIQCFNKEKEKHTVSNIDIGA